MTMQRIHIVLPTELIAEIDAEVGPRRRSAFLAETARAELNRRKLLAFAQPDWKDEVIFGARCDRTK
jgi:metal-responsive CopG/Arc/MetJ family transcriptional regulator